MRDLIILKSKNIGSLCLFLRNPKNKEILDHINQGLDSELNLVEKVYLYLNYSFEIPLCLCGNRKKFNSFKVGYQKTCGEKKCFVQKRKMTCLENFGFDNPKKSKDIIDREMVGIYKKWNGKHYMEDESVRNKFKKTMLINWGVEWAQQSVEIKLKSKETWENNIEKDDIINRRRESIIKNWVENSDSILLKRYKTINDNWGNWNNYVLNFKESFKSTSFKNWGIESPQSHPEIIKKITETNKKTNLDKWLNKLPANIKFIEIFKNSNKTDRIFKLLCTDCNSDFFINRQYLDHRTKNNDCICLKCNPQLSGRSKMEMELENFIRSNYQGDVEICRKNIIDGEIDIYLPSIKLAFEFNGLFWHSNLFKDKYYHQIKTNGCKELGITLTHIWEDEWVFNNASVKNSILQILNSLNIDKIKVEPNFYEIIKGKRVISDNILNYGIYDDGFN